MVPHNIPHQMTITNEIFTKSLCVKGILSEKFKLLDSKVSFTFDTSTFQTYNPYLMVTGH